jgi:CheY-like chemotaxis protein
MTTELLSVGRTVLVVDDEAPLRRVVGRALERLGCAVLEAADGAEAVRVVESGRHRISLILLDVRMPGMSGDEAFPVLRRLAPAVPIIMMTAFAKEGVIERLRELGAAAVLVKPFEMEELLGAVSAALYPPGRGPSGA